MKWLSLVLAGVIVVLLFLWPDYPEVNTQPWKDTLRIKEAEIKKLTAQRDTLLNEIKQDSINHAEKQKSLLSQANAFKREVDRLKANPVVIKVREENPEVDSLIIAQDSIITNQGYQIAAYEHQLSKLQVNMTAIVQNFESNLELERERFEAQEQLTIAAMQETKRQKRQKLKVGIIAGLAGIAIGFVGGGF